MRDHFPAATRIHAMLVGKVRAPWRVAHAKEPTISPSTQSVIGHASQVCRRLTATYAEGFADQMVRSTSNVRP